MTPTIINKFGRIVGWNNITMHMLGRDVEGITEIEYDDSVTKENEYGAGGFPMGQSEGNYEPKASITLYSEELEAIQSALPAGTRIQQIPAFPITVAYDRNGVVTKDVLQNASFKTVGKAVKQGDGKITHKCELLISHIDWRVA